MMPRSNRAPRSLAVVVVVVAACGGPQLASEANEYESALVGTPCVNATGPLPGPAMSSTISCEGTGIGSEKRIESASELPAPWLETITVYSIAAPGIALGFEAPFTGSESVSRDFTITRFTFTSESTWSSMFQKPA